MIWQWLAWLELALARPLSQLRAHYRLRNLLAYSPWLRRTPADLWQALGRVGECARYCPVEVL